MINKIETAWWFARQPAFWAHGFALARRKVKPNHDTPELKRRARDWAAERACSVEDALDRLSLGTAIPAIDPRLLDEARALAGRSPVKMGGAGDLRLLYAATLLSGAKDVLETGVAYGWSSLAVLSALQGRGGKLVSVDMPYPNAGNESYVGIAVPDRLREQWTLIRKPDRPGIDEGLAMLGNAVDLCHYDSDKSWWGREYAYPRLWTALRPGGVFISDDIQDNLGFRDFVESQGATFAVTESEGKYVGIARKEPVIRRGQLFTQPPQFVSSDSRLPLPVAAFSAVPSEITA